MRTINCTDVKTGSDFQSGKDESVVLPDIRKGHNLDVLVILREFFGGGVHR